MTGIKMFRGRLMRFRSRFLFFVLVAAAAGCSLPQKYSEPAPGSEAADLVLSRRVPPHLGRVVHYVHAYENDRCVETRGSGFLATLIQPSSEAFNLPKVKEEHSVRVVAGRPLFIRMRASQVVDSRRQSTKVQHCDNLVSFTPVDGNAYSIKQLYDGDQCITTVLDTARQAPPRDFVALPAGGSCGR